MNPERHEKRGMRKPPVLGVSRRVLAAVEVASGMAQETAAPEAVSVAMAATEAAALTEGMDGLEMAPEEEAMAPVEEIMAVEAAMAEEMAAGMEVARAVAHM